MAEKSLGYFGDVNNEAIPIVSFHSVFNVGIPEHKSLVSTY